MKLFTRLWDAILLKLFPPVHEYHLTHKARKAMQAMAQQTHPKEAFGVLRGRRVGAVLVIENVAYQPFTNTQTSAQVALNPWVLSDMVGTFHSHPVPDDRASTADRHLFARTPGVHCIVPYPYTSVTVYKSDGTVISFHKL